MPTKAIKRGLIACLAVLGLSIVPLARSAHGVLAQSCPGINDLVDTNQAFPKLDNAHSAGLSNFKMFFVSPLKGTNGAPLTINNPNWGNVMYFYYIKFDPAGNEAVGLATTPDGVSFTDRGLVLDVGPSGAWDSYYASFPDVWLDNGTYYMAYEGFSLAHGAKIGLATSSNGINWTKYAQNPILTNNTSGWESGGIGTPMLYKVGSTWYLYYTAADSSQVYRIGVATGTDLTSLTKYNGNPVIDVGPSGVWDSGTAGRRGILQAANGTHYMVYEGSTSYPFNTAQWSSGVASSADLLHWTKFSQNNIIPQTQGGSTYTAYGNDGPTILALNGTTWLYYQAQINGGNNTLRAQVANDTCGGYDYEWGATDPALGHNTGNPSGSNWVAMAGHDAQGYMQFGPYATNLSADSSANPRLGDNIAIWKLMIDNNTADNNNMVRLEVADYDNGDAIIAQRIITRQQWHAANDFEYFYVPFNLSSSEAGHRLEFRVYWYGSGTVTEQLVGISTSSTSGSGGCVGSGYYELVNTATGNLLRTTIDIYNGNTGLYYAITVPSSWNDDYLKWQFVDVGGGYCKLVNKATGNLLRNTLDTYNGNTGLYYAITVPSSWNDDYLKWTISNCGTGGSSDGCAMADKATSNLLRTTTDTYNGNTGLYYAITVPSSWNDDYLKWTIVPAS